ncbi:hypothetical protein HZ326_22495 [Fusarium oxysporum f. sp. albedinis]|nr:hypothetical protein HZ326_22495 [Fusarium oxysporum f. sp. albedinis]
MGPKQTQPKSESELLRKTFFPKKPLKNHPHSRLQDQTASRTKHSISSTISPRSSISPSPLATIRNTFDNPQRWSSGSQGKTTIPCQRPTGQSLY